MSHSTPRTSRALGTLAWARRTGGRLSTADRLELIGQGIAIQLERIPGKLRRALGLPRASAPLDLDPLIAPDSSVARAAEEAVAAVSPEPLVHHCYRSYAWGRLLAAGRGHRLDPELFYVAALLHDLGLAEIEPAADSCCFAYDGAEAALRVLDEVGYDPGRSALVADAISLHLNVRVSLRRHGAEAHYLNAATALDVIGLGLKRIPPEPRRRILEAHPRDGWNESIRQLLGDEVRKRPGCRIHFLAQSFGFVPRAAKLQLAP